MKLLSLTWNNKYYNEYDVDESMVLHEYSYFNVYFDKKMHWSTLSWWNSKKEGCLDDYPFKSLRLGRLTISWGKYGDWEDKHLL